MSHNFVQKWFSHSTEKFRRGTLRFSDFFLSKKFMDRKGISRFSLETFLSDSPEKVPSVTLLIENFSGLKKCIRWCITILSEIDFRTVPKRFVGVPFFFQKIFFHRKFLWIGWGYHDFLWNFFCLTVPKKIPKRTLLFRKLLD